MSDYPAPAPVFSALFVGNGDVIPVEVVRTNGARATVTVKRREPMVPSESVSVGPAWLVLRPEVVRLATDRRMSAP